MRYVPVAGTWASNDPWVIDDQAALTTLLRAHGLAPARLPNGEAWNWDAALSGTFFRGVRGWVASSYSLESFLATLPYQDRNLIAHSHGGQVSIFAAARGVKIRTLTTVGTPRRFDVPAEEAAKNIGYWQHICDAKRDWMGTLRRRLGAIGDHHFSTERRFIVPGVVNYQLQRISHSKILRDPTMIKLWETQGWADAIFNGPARRMFDAPNS